MVSVGILEVCIAILRNCVGKVSRKKGRTKILVTDDGSIQCLTFEYCLKCCEGTTGLKKSQSKQIFEKV